MNAVFVLALVLPLIQAPDQRPSSEANPAATLRGTVVDERGRAVPGVVLVLHGGPRPAVFTTIADTDGAFRFDEVPADSYTLRAMKSGYPPIEYGQTQPLGPGAPIVLHSGESPTISLRMPRGAVITGTVRDEHGTPLEGQLVLVTRTDGSQLPPGLMRSPVNTDGFGRFRIFGLPSGAYAVKARRTSGTFIRNAPLSNEVQVSVSVGEERGGIELRLPPLTVPELR